MMRAAGHGMHAQTNGFQQALFISGNDKRDILVEENGYFINMVSGWRMFSIALIFSILVSQCLSDKVEVILGVDNTDSTSYEIGLEWQTDEEDIVISETVSYTVYLLHFYRHQRSRSSYFG